MQTSGTYYVRRRGRIDGPWSFEKLRSEVVLRKLGRHHEISTDGVQWRPAGSVEMLFVTEDSPIKATHGSLEWDDETENAKQNTIGSGSGYDASVTRSVAVKNPEISLRKQWYYYCDGERHGPTGFEELLDAATAGQLNADSLVWREGMPDWLPAEQITELSGVVRDRSGSSQDVVDTTESAGANKSGAKVGIPVIDRWGIAAAAMGVAVLGCSLISGLGLMGVVAIVLGSLSLRRIRRSHDTRTGAIYAKVGIALGLLATAIGVIRLFFSLHSG